MLSARPLEAGDLPAIAAMCAAPPGATRVAGQGSGRQAARPGTDFPLATGQPFGHIRPFNCVRHSGHFAPTDIWRYRWHAVTST